jgi:hypothetical protein
VPDFLLERAFLIPEVVAEGIFGARMKGFDGHFHHLCRMSLSLL